MQRRVFMRRVGAGAALGGFVMGAGVRPARGNPGGGLATPAGAARDNQLALQLEKAHRAMKPLKITRVRCILTQPGGPRLAVVKVETDEPGLYGLGCATFTQRIKLVKAAVEEYLDPFLRGQDPANIEDIWQATYQSSYWRNGPVLMNALSGLDSALWDINGKRAGMPVYQLLGGKARVAVPAYGHASGTDGPECLRSVQERVRAGFKYVRLQMSDKRQSGYGTRGAAGRTPYQGHFAGDLYEPALYARMAPRMFDFVRGKVGPELELLHDVHERLNPIQALQLVKDLEPYRLFFIEDPFAPEDQGYFEILRKQSNAPIAMGELWNNPNEWLDLVSRRLIDFVRCHISQIGGVSVARKIANLAEFFRVRTAWHGPGDCSPVGHAANCHVDLAIWNFGIQEAALPSDLLREVFPGAPTFKDGMLWVNEAPGLGVDLNEALAAKHPITEDPPFDMFWGRVRDVDGTIRRP